MARFGLTLFRELAKVPTSSKGPVVDSTDLAIILHCGKDGSAFRAVLVPITGGYAIRTISRIDPAASDISRDEDATASTDRSIPVHLILWSNEKCPCCGAKIAPIRCDRCGKLICDASRSKRDGRAWFKCEPACGVEGPIVSASVEARARQAPDPLMLPSGSMVRLAAPAPGMRSLPDRGRV